MSRTAIKKTTFFALALAIFLVPTANAANTCATKELHWQDYELPGYQAAQRSQYQAAEFMLTTAIERLNVATHPDDSKILQLLERLITVCGKEGKYDVAEQYCNLAIQFAERMPNSSVRTELLKLGLAHIYGKLRKYSLAEINYERALASKTLPKSARARAIIGLAEVQTKEGKYATASSLFKQALEGPETNSEPALPADHVRYARLLYLQGQTSSSEAQLKETLLADERDLGPSQPYLAATLNDLALVCMKANRPAEAEQYMRRAVAIARQHRYADLGDWQENLVQIQAESARRSASKGQIVKRIGVAGKFAGAKATQ
jgi:tetratricopeptide (TPR) repeat protein